MSGVFGQAFGLKYSLLSDCESSVKYSVSSCLVLRQVKYVYDWLKPSLESRCMIRGRVNASERKIVSGCFFFSSVMTQPQNVKGLVCGLSTRKIFTPCPIQNSNTLFSSSESPLKSEESNSKG